MAKMKIYEIVSSMQRQFPNLQNKDVVTLLQENGFEVKGSQSVIEDDAIGFLLKHAKEHLSDSKKFLIKLTGLFLFHSHLYTNCISCEKVYSKAINWIAYSLARLALTSITTG